MDVTVSIMRLEALDFFKTNPTGVAAIIVKGSTAIYKTTFTSRKLLEAFA